MPAKPKIGCRWPGCPAKIAPGQGYCEAHRKPAQRVYDKARGSVRDRLYGTPEWVRLRARHLTSRPNCVDCGDTANVVDHDPPHRGDRAAFFDPARLVSLCRPCHSRRTASSDGGFGNPTRPRPRS